MIIRSLIIAALCCVSVHGADIWFAGPSHTIARTEKKPASSALYDAKTKTVQLFAARNEFVSFQIVYSGETKGVNVEPLKLVNGKDSVTAEFSLEHYLPCPIVTQYDGKSRPKDVEAMNKLYTEKGYAREFPEQLVPLSAKKYGAPFDVAADKNEVVWADIFVPETAAPGVYKGTLKTAGQEFNVSLTVWNFTLPSVSHFPNWIYIGPEEIAWAFGKQHTQLASDLSAVYDSYFQLAHDHRCCLLEEWRNDASYVKQTRKYWEHATGAAFKGPFAAGFGFELIELDNDEPYSPDELKQQNWLNRAFVFLHPDEPHDKSDYDQIRSNGARIKTQFGALRRLVTKQQQSTEALGSLDDAVDIFCSGAVPVDAIPDLESRGKVVWTYNAGHAGAPNTDAPGAACRTHAWAGFVSGARAWFYWDGGYCVDKQFKWREVRRNIYKDPDPSKYVSDLWNNAMTFDETLRNHGRYSAASAMRMNGEGMLFYPGKEAGINAAIPCFRLKNLRQGATDFEYLYLLEKMGKRDAALDEAKKLLGAAGSGVMSTDGQQQGSKRFNDYEIDGEKWDAARIRLGNLLNGIGDKALREKIQPYNQYPNSVGHPDFFGGKRY